MRKGISLIEVLVAATLLAITISAMMMVFAVQHKISEDMKRKNIALMLIQDQFEKIKSRKDISQLITSLEDKKFTIGNVIYKLEFEDKQVHFENDDPCVVYEVKAKVSYSIGNTQKMVCMATRTN